MNTITYIKSKDAKLVNMIHFIIKYNIPKNTRVVFKSYGSNNPNGRFCETDEYCRNFIVNQKGIALDAWSYYKEALKELK